MRNGKRPTKKQKIFMKSKGLNYENWLVVKDTTESFEIINRVSNKVRRYNKVGG